MAAGMAFSWGRAVTPQRAQEAFLPLVTTRPVGEEAYHHALQIVSLCLDHKPAEELHGLSLGANAIPNEAESEVVTNRPLYLTYAAFVAVIVLWAHAIGLSRAETASNARHPKNDVWYVEGNTLKRADASQGLGNGNMDVNEHLNLNETREIDEASQLQHILQRGLKQSRQEFHEIETIKADVRCLMRIIRDRLKNSSWEISQEAEQVLEGLINKNGFMD